MPVTTEERIFLVEFVFREGDKYTMRVQERFKEQFPNTKVPYRDTVLDLIKKFRRTGSVKDEGRSGRPTKLDENKLDEYGEVVSKLKNIIFSTNCNDFCMLFDEIILM